MAKRPPPNQERLFYMPPDGLVKSRAALFQGAMRGLCRSVEDETFETLEAAVNSLDDGNRYKENISYCLGALKDLHTLSKKEDLQLKDFSDEQLGFLDRSLTIIRSCADGLMHSGAVESNKAAQEAAHNIARMEHLGSPRALKAQAEKEMDRRAKEREEGQSR